MCHCTLEQVENKILCCKELMTCYPAKPIDGKWEAVDDKLEKVIMVEMPRREGKLNFYELYKKTVEDKKKYCEWEIHQGDEVVNPYTKRSCCGLSGGTYKYCPYCGLEIKEVKP